MEELSAFVHLTPKDLEDLAWWRRLLTPWNGLSLMRFRAWDRLPDFSMTSDAAGSVGLGIVFGTHWCFQGWPADLPAAISISVLEMVPLVVAAHLWGHLWGRCRILFETDNTGVEFSAASGLPKDPHLCFLLRELSILALTHNFDFQVRHLPGVSNKLADLVSRQRFRAFKDLHPGADRTHIPPPSGLLRHLLFPDL